MRRQKTNRKSAFEAALHLLSYRGQSEWELNKKLKDREYTPAEIKEAIQKLKKYDYINDAELASDVFDSYRTRACYGDSYIHKKMKFRGLSTNKHIPKSEELCNAETLLEKKEKIVPGFLEEYRRAVGFLSRRGFQPGTIIEAIKQARNKKQEE